jgi:hypothetical protein
MSDIRFCEDCLKNFEFIDTGDTKCEVCGRNSCRYCCGWIAHYVLCKKCSEKAQSKRDLIHNKILSVIRDIINEKS